ncbi:hypothetical protein Tcan_14851 [Toxocara canis]|uniref:Uncharacterized protein n=1 Tax=Toxocara canis TaxID=6265 RepID=A0A0B2VKG3_TOXCA|nr:hypothetical protein Tcan_14851 [Toxocara canis]
MSNPRTASATWNISHKCRGHSASTQQSMFHLTDIQKADAQNDIDARPSFYK